MSTWVFVVSLVLQLGGPPSARAQLEAHDRGQAQGAAEAQRRLLEHAQECQGVTPLTLPPPVDSTTSAETSNSADRLQPLLYMLILV